MAFKDSSIFLKLAPIVQSVAALFIVIGLSTNYWAQLDVNYTITTVSANYGIWKAYAVSICASYPNTPGSIGAVRAFTILGFLVIAVGIVLSFLCLFVFDMTKKKMHMIAAAPAFVSGGFELLGAIIGAAKFTDLLSAVSYSNYMLSWSFGLSLIGALGAIAGGAILLVPTIRPQPQGSTVNP